MKIRMHKILKAAGALALAAALVSLNGCESSGGGGPAPEKITSIAWVNSRTLPLPHMNASGDMVWVQTGETTSGVYLYRNGSVAKITTDDAVRHQFPQISDSGQVIWVSKPENSQDVYAYKSGAASKIVSITGIPAFPRQNASGAVVWHNMTGVGLEIFKWDNNVTTQVSNTGRNGFPQISDTGEIIWLGNDDNGELQVYDFKNGTVTRKSDVPVNTIPQADEGNIPVFNNINSSGAVVWNGRETPDGPNQVYINKNGVVTRLTNTAYSSSRPQIADNDHVVWQTAELDDLGNITTDIYYWHNGVTKRITSGVRAESPMVNSEGQIVWEQTDGNDTEIFLYSNGKNFQVTDNSICDVAPRIYNDGTILWVTEDSDSKGIIYRQILKTSADYFTGSGWGVLAQPSLISSINRGSTRALSVLAGLKSPLKGASPAPTVSPSAADTAIEVFIVWGGSRGKDSDMVQGSFYPKKYYINNNWVSNFANYAAGYPDTMPVTSMFFLGDAATFGRDNELDYPYWQWFDLLVPFVIRHIPIYSVVADRDLKNPSGNATMSLQDEFANHFFPNVPENGPQPSYWMNYNKVVYYLYYEDSDTFVLNMDTFPFQGTAGNPLYDAEVDDNQLSWLQGLIDNNPNLKSARNKIIITHAPAFDPEGNFNQPNLTNRSQLWKKLADAHFDLYLAGHARLFSEKQFIMDPFRDGLMYENAMWQVISGAGGAELDDWDKVNANTTDWKIRRIQSFLLVKIYQHGIKVLVFRSNNMDFSEPPILEDGAGQNPDLTIWIPK